MDPQTKLEPIADFYVPLENTQVAVLAYSNKISSGRTTCAKRTFLRGSTYNSKLSSPFGHSCSARDINRDQVPADSFWGSSFVSTFTFSHVSRDKQLIVRQRPPE
ncbi:hypothetical protein J6590_067927 [Homalodisca vitripennis]|nr:hypothetical protein J6590_067927 [Homalodisca vitripennis]